MWATSESVDRPPNWTGYEPVYSLDKEEADASTCLNESNIEFLV